MENLEQKPQSRVVSLDDDTIVKQAPPTFKGQQDHFYRVHIPNPEMVFMYHQHFDENAKKFLHCLRDKGEECPACEKVGEPTKKFKLNLIVYNTTTEDGTAPDDLNYVSLTTNVWKFGSKIWSVLRTKHKKFAKSGGLKGIDLILKCTNGQYQHFDIEDDSTCLINESDRLKSMFEKVKQKFADFNDPDDYDNKFPTKRQVEEWLASATGQSVQLPSEDGQGDDIPPISPTDLEPEAQEARIGDLI